MSLVHCDVSREDGLTVYSLLQGFVLGSVVQHDYTWALYIRTKALY